MQTISNGMYVITVSRVIGDGGGRITLNDANQNTVVGI